MRISLLRQKTLRERNMDHPGLLEVGAWLKNEPIKIIYREI
jgi:hypothetical protein